MEESQLQTRFKIQFRTKLLFVLGNELFLLENLKCPVLLFVGNLIFIGVVKQTLTLSLPLSEYPGAKSSPPAPSSSSSKASVYEGICDM